MGWSRQTYQSPCHVLLRTFVCIIAVCLITVLFLCSAVDTYILRHSLASRNTRLVLTGSSLVQKKFQRTFKHNTATRFSKLNNERTD